jgi:hypothetical protein
MGHVYYKSLFCIKHEADGGQKLPYAFEPGSVAEDNQAVLLGAICPSGYFRKQY